MFFDAFDENVKSFCFFSRSLGNDGFAVHIWPQKRNEMAYKLSDETQHCLECGSVILSYGGRKDRKFCSTSCKNKYWNRKTNSRQGYQLKIISQLDRNYRILSRLLSIGVLSVKREDLLLLGFHFDLMTGHRRVMKRDWNECFDIRYLQMPSRISNLQFIPVEDAAVSQKP